LNLLDSSAWLAYFANEPNAEAFEPIVLDLQRLVVPSVCIYEVYKVMHRQQGEAAADEAVAQMRRGHSIPLDYRLAVDAGDISLTYQLRLTDSVIYATALAYEALLWTQDADFANLPSVRFVAKRNPSQ
jgi:predicted nucleic acid-binding protein